MDVEPAEGVGAVGGEGRDHLVGDGEEEGGVGVEEGADQGRVGGVEPERAEAEGGDGMGHLLWSGWHGVRGRGSGGVGGADGGGGCGKRGASGEEREGEEKGGEREKEVGHGYGALEGVSWGLNGIENEGRESWKV